MRETNESYIAKVESKFPNMLNWEGFTYPKNQHVKIIFKCKTCGEFESTPNVVLNVKIHPCRTCSSKITNKAKTGDIPAFIEKCKKKYGDRYSYHKVYFKAMRENIIVTCNIHKEDFEINANNFLYSAKVGCPKCIQDKIKNTQRLTKEEYIEKCNKIHKDKYDLSEIDYQGTDRKIKVKCKTCEHVWYPSAKNFYGGSGCPICANISKNYRWNDRPTSLYIIEVFENEQYLYKIGITIRTLEERYSNEYEKPFKVIYTKLYETGELPHIIEQKTRSALDKYNYKGENIFKRTNNNEIFTINPLDTILKISEQEEKEFKEKHNIKV